MMFSLFPNTLILTKSLGRNAVGGNVKSRMSRPIRACTRTQFQFVCEQDCMWITTDLIKNTKTAAHREAVTSVSTVLLI